MEAEMNPRSVSSLLYSDAMESEMVRDTPMLGLLPPNSKLKSKVVKKINQGVK